MIAKKSVEKVVPSAGGGSQDLILRAPHGSHTRKVILGRGLGSKRGRTSTRGHKGHRSRTGFKALPFFEGGQMPLARRLPKFGFSNSPFKKTYQVIALKDLDMRFEAGAEITYEALREKKLFKGRGALVKITNRDKFFSLSKTFKFDLKKIRLTASVRQILETGGSQFIN